MRCLRKKTSSGVSSCRSTVPRTVFPSQSLAFRRRRLLFLEFPAAGCDSMRRPRASERTFLPYQCRCVASPFCCATHRASLAVKNWTSLNRKEELRYGSSAYVCVSGSSGLRGAEDARSHGRMKYTAESRKRCAEPRWKVNLRHRPQLQKRSALMPLLGGRWNKADSLMHYPTSCAASDQPFAVPGAESSLRMN